MGDADEPWREFFGFEAPYDQQADAIGAAIEAGDSDGFLAMEGLAGRARRWRR